MILFWLIHVFRDEFRFDLRLKIDFSNLCMRINGESRINENLKFGLNMIGADDSFP